MPIAPPRGRTAAHTAATLPGDVTGTLLSVITNFTTTLSTLACERDYYSPLDVRGLPGGVPPLALLGVVPALRRVDERLYYLHVLLVREEPCAGPATLLPCLETCNAADRACPNFLGFKCPLPQFTAADSYGVGYIDEGEEGVVGGGATGVAQDVYGNVWCNVG
ncbi:hypothetical protein BN946_scf184873.g4 [Trametes cinnabarina]|uniref:FZ domain-containing protein n=1 Tax=Pycnoporus cinnabarinus TaxID=5643 RepID=A0A060SNF9_PYCCI|nr:hypothetical protein BN946_scf184873.g4 [Trametes cinnabarina]